MAEPEKWPRAAEEIAAAVRSGEWPVGERLPGFPALAARLRVAERTARKAVAHLARLGVLEIRPSTGTFVASVPADPLPSLPAGAGPLGALEARLAAVEGEQARQRERLDRLERGE